MAQINRNSNKRTLSSPSSGGIGDILNRDSAKCSEGEDNAVTESTLVGVGDLFLLGIAIVIGGQYFGWNEGLESM